jgi:uncharacterized protein involved in exopolysaccharide biosynthesis
MLRRRYLILTPSLAAGVIACLVTLRSPREYTASASFIPQDPASVSSQAGLGQLASQFGLLPSRPGTSSPQFYANLLQSREVLRGVLLTSYGTPGATDSSHDLLHYLQITRKDADAAVADGIERLRRRLTVRTDRTTGVVSFDIHTTVPSLSAQIARRFLELVNDYNLRRRQSQARAEREFVEQRLALAEDTLSVAEDALSSFFKRNRRYTDSPELVADEARLQRRVTLRQQLYLNLAQSHDVAEIEEVRNTPVITVVEPVEGSVEPRSRGTLLKILAAIITVGLAAIGVAFSSEYVATARQAGSDEYFEFAGHLRAVWVDVRRVLTRRSRR